MGPTLQEQTRTQERRNRMVPGSHELFRGDGPEYRCLTCGGHEVEARVPGWYDMNRSWAHVDMDEGAEPEGYWCRLCQDEVTVHVLRS